MFNGILIIVHTFIEIILIASFLDAFRIIIDGFKLTIAKINTDGCICTSNSKITIANGRKFSKYKTNQ